VNIRVRVLIGVLAGIMLAGFAPSAHAIFGLHKAKKNTSPYAYLAPPKKNQKPNGWYQSTLTGKMVYGKPPKKK